MPLWVNPELGLQPLHERQLRQTAHEDVPVSGEVYSVGGGRVARVFIGVTPGYTNKESLTPEDVRALQQDRSPDVLIRKQGIRERRFLVLFNPWNVLIDDVIITVPSIQRITSSLYVGRPREHGRSE